MSSFSPLARQAVQALPQRQARSLPVLEARDPPR